MTVNPFEQSTQQLLRFLTSHAEWEVIDYIRQEMQHDAPDSVPTEDELFTFFQSPDEPTKLDAYQQMLATDKLLEYAEISLRTLCDLIRYMKALQKRFDHQSHPELDTQIEYVREELRRDMDTAGRRKLLRLLDVQNTLLARSTLMSFTAGFKLAAGIAGELGTPYSFDADEEEKAKEMITNG